MKRQRFALREPRPSLFSRLFTRSKGSEDAIDSKGKPSGVDTIAAGGEVKYRRVSELTGFDVPNSPRYRPSHRGGDRPSSDATTVVGSDYKPSHIEPFGIDGDHKHRQVSELTGHNGRPSQLYNPGMGIAGEPDYFALGAKPRRRGATREFVNGRSSVDSVGPQSLDMQSVTESNPVTLAGQLGIEPVEPNSAIMLAETTEHMEGIHETEEESSMSTPITTAKEVVGHGSHPGDIVEIQKKVEEQAGEDTREARIFRYNSELLSVDWTRVRDLLPESWKWDVEYQNQCWTCTPLDLHTPENYPLEISGSPVVLPVEHHWPPVGGINPPPDPRSSAPIDCRSALSLNVARDVFLTFEGSVGFYLLINGLLQIIVPEKFDVVWAASHLPHKYGGLKVCYIDQNLKPTMMPLAVTATSQSKPMITLKGVGLSKIFKTSRTSRDLSGRPLKLNDFIEARLKGTHRKENYAARIGLKVAKAEEPYLVMSTHVITEAILAKSHRKSIFPRSRGRFDKLDDDWNRHISIWAYNERIGTIDRSFDDGAETYPNGFRHDVTLIRPSTPASIKDMTSPIPDIGWLNKDSWNALRQQTSAVKFLGPIEAHRSAKSIRSSHPSEILVVGEGIFLNQTAAAGNSKSLEDSDRSTWHSLVSRALLYRVHPDFDPPSGYSGVALYTDGTRQDGTIGPGIVGFQSFVQRSGHVQSFNMEGPALDRRLQLGRVAFYGAFEVPEELKRDYTIV